MENMLKRYATPFITGFFLISLISGVALFLHVGQNYFRGMHEWLSVVLILPFALHLWKNWRPMMNYIGRAPFAIASVVSIVAALAFVVPSLGSSGGAGGPPQFAVSRVVLTNTTATVAPLFGISNDKLIADLKAKGFTAAADGLQLSAVATQSGKDEMELMAVLAAEKP